jgi:phosphatidylethanolamine-binding protein (PEBP) family uncharacterized protein
MAVFSTARGGNLVISPVYTCHGANISPPVLWAGAPTTSKEIGIFVRTIILGHLTTDWAVVGISPKIQKIAAGKLPEGAIVGRNSSGKVGYSLCPPNGSLVTLGVYAFPHALGLKTGFDPESLKTLLSSGEVEWGGLPMLARAEPSIFSGR